MGIENKLSLEDRIFQNMMQECETARESVGIYYPDGCIAPFSFPTEQTFRSHLLKQAKALPKPQDLTQEQMAETCQLVRANVKQGKANNAEVQLNKGRQLSGKCKFPLGDTVLKLRVMDTDEPEYFFMKAGNMLDSSIFLGGDNAGILLIQDENGDDCFLRLSEFHMLSLREAPDPRKDVGLITSYLWLTAEVSTSVILAASLDPIKSLLLSDWLQSEWQRAKDAASTSPGADGGETHG